MPDEESLHIIADALATPASGFKPVFLDQPLPRTLRQTFLRHMNNCPRSAYLAAKYDGQDQTKEMVRGSAVHEILKRATAQAISMNEPMIPPDVVKTIVDEVLAEMPVPMEEHDYIREMAWRWASEVTFDPGLVIALESLFQLQVGDWTVRARIDFAESLEDDTALLIRDYKSSRAAPPYEEVARKDAEGRLVAKNFQLIVYALLMRYGVPVREEQGLRCFSCGHLGVPQGIRLSCPRCDKTLGGFPEDAGRPLEWLAVETPEPFPLAAGARDFRLEFVYPGIEDREGKMVTRPLVMNQLELEEYRSSLEGLVARVAKAEESGDSPAVVSDAACSECPAPGECPIPQEVRNWRGRINTPEQAAEAAMVLDRQKAELRAAQTELRNFAKANGAIRYGGKVMELVYSEHESFDRARYFDDMNTAESYIPAQEDYVTVKGRTDFKSRDLTADEQGGEG